MPSKIDIRTHSYFPNNFIILGILFLPVSVALIFMHTIGGIALLLLGLLFTTTHYRLTIDPKSKSYRDYVWILGIRRGRWYSYEEISHIYINKVERSSEYGFVARLSTYKMVLAGYIKLANGESLYLGETASEEKLFRKMKEVSEALENINIKKNF